MKYLGYSVNTGAENMRIDSEMLDDSIANESKGVLFRLYGWKPMCISLGRNQKEDFLNQNIDYVRRLTGGRALLHDNEVTYCCVAPIERIPNGQSVTDSYKYISGILIDFFKTLGIELDFGENKKVSTHFDYCMLLSTGADVCYKGRKIIGSAQCRKNGYIMQHGSILFGYDKKLLEELFHEEVKGIVTVTEILPDMTKEVFVRKFEEYLKNIRN